MSSNRSRKQKKQKTKSQRSKGKKVINTLSTKWARRKQNKELHFIKMNKIEKSLDEKEKKIVFKMLHSRIVKMYIHVDN